MLTVLHTAPSSFLLALLSLDAYIGMGYGLFSMLKACQLRGAWMAWFPVLSLYKVGQLSDHYSERNKGRNPGLRALLYTLLSLLPLPIPILFILLAKKEPLYTDVSLPTETTS